VEIKDVLRKLLLSEFAFFLSNLFLTLLAIWGGNILSNSEKSLNIRLTVSNYEGWES